MSCQRPQPSWCQWRRQWTSRQIAVNRLLARARACCTGGQMCCLYEILTSTLSITVPPVLCTRLRRVQLCVAGSYRTYLFEYMYCYMY